MRTLRAWLFRTAALFRHGRAGEAFDVELDSHLQLHVDDNLRAGMTPDAARRDAILKLGGVTQTLERYRERQRPPFVDALRQDLTYAVRTLGRSPGFASTAVLTLALGIGANTAIFSVVNAVLLRPLPYPDPDRLVMVFATNTKTGDTTDVASYPDYLDWAQAGSLERLGAFAGRNVTITGSGEAEYVFALRVSSTLFDTLGVRPALGRGIRADEEQAGSSHVVVLSDAYWKSRYAGAADALGRTVRINEELFTIVGVMPPGVRISQRGNEQFYVPLVADSNRNHGFLEVVGRLRRGATRRQAHAEVNVIAERIAGAFPKSNATVRANVMPLADALAVNVHTGLLVLVGVVALVLLIACTNVASLMLARATARQRELSVRAALGAGRARIVRQLLTESMLLAAGGGAAGLVVGAWTARALAAMLATQLPRGIPRVETTGIDAWVLGFTIILSLVTGIVFGVAPAVAASAHDLHATLREDGRSTSGRRAPLLRRGLVVLETALALVLLAGAGVLLKSLWAMQTVPRGFESDHVLAVDLWLPQPRFARLADRARFFTDTLDRLRSTPGVRSAGFVADLPLNGGSDGLGFHIVGRPDPEPAKSFTAGFNVASAGYFETMRIAVRSGRVFSDDDRSDSPGVVVVNETAARRLWPNESPIGHSIAMPVESEQPDEHERTNGELKSVVTLMVVGVVADVRDINLSKPARPEFYLESRQARLAWPWLVLAVRTTADPETLTATVREIVKSTDANVPILKFSSMDGIVSRSIAEPRAYTILLSAFAGLALTLAAIGLYGLISFSVSQRTHEIGVRVALGAARGEILRLVLAQGLHFALLGTAIGLVAAWGATRVLVGLVGGVEATDPISFALVSALLIVVAIAATWLPARRAARVDPVIALRSE
jgi:putative ABC transport system permease protein